ncbi:type IV pilus twitching motility protein PilT [Paramixta manurensis]|uniref:Type IV pilus twitching motility protein PilT n=1 Tax=Paramixta manurensis TaxID=2740817 RepID=A0A6M8UNR6_9GAMM|nr:type IV pilus twitching motility protein PilT [Erwiniaceae bacterium PD-1]
MDIEEILALSVKHNAADLHLCSGHLPQWRRDGVLEAVPGQTVVDGALLESWARRWLTAAQQACFESSGQVDFAFSAAEGARVRASLFEQRAGLSLALRLIASTPMALEALQAPKMIEKLLRERDGLILVTGATGSGKSSTLAAMVAALNQRGARHILTLEDPIEFVHHSQHSLIQQREIGQHCCSYQQGLRAALRADPDVILLGELRDIETIRLALTAAETGHLVLTTLHTRGATQAVERLVDVFPGEEKSAVRSQLAGSLKAVIAQRLVPARQGGRVALFELLLNTPAVANLIREGKSHQLPAVLQTGAQAGMQSFEQCLRERVSAGLVAEEV